MVVLVVVLRPAVAGAAVPAVEIAIRNPQIVADGNMKIDWQALEACKPGLYCYAVTVKDGAMIRNRAYYHVEETQKNKMGNSILDNLLDRGLVTCFSCGYEGASNATKYDLHICVPAAEEIYGNFVCFDYFQYPKIDLFQTVSAEKKVPSQNRIIGVQATNQGREIQSICLYYRCLNNPKIVECREFIYELCKRFGLKTEFCLPLEGETPFLRLIALDFGEKIFKLKFYFQYQPRHDVRQIISAFKKSVNFHTIQEIANSNGRICGLQIATVDNGEITYNFYLKARRAAL